MAGEDGGSDDELVIFSRKDDQRALRIEKGLKLWKGAPRKV
jgi:hypothetical protein